MEQQQAQQIEQQFRQNWQQIRYQILDQFGQVGSSDLNAARDVNDLVQRIADRSNHSEQYVARRLRELADVGAQASQAQATRATQEATPSGQQSFGGRQQPAREAGAQQGTQQRSFGATSQ
ncbi:hypothetical protein [Candidatus Protofrankia californiensis]|uniref:hypothetical protein n=1 Tax=Candidatus Protofrankia californiensis TaxID=1839754 RepID=UPI0010419577|nr:hypothetical protein [Candidatus Protofrankia californiensis]